MQNATERWETPAGRHFVIGSDVNTRIIHLMIGEPYFHTQCTSARRPLAATPAAAAPARSPLGGPDHAADHAGWPAAGVVPLMTGVGEARELGRGESRSAYMLYGMVAADTPQKWQRSAGCFMRIPFVFCGQKPAPANTKLTSSSSGDS